MPMKESNATERTFQGLFSRNVKRMSPVMMAVTATITVAAIVYPKAATTVATTTTPSTIHSNQGLPS
jgi:hypothetical protein